MDTLPCLQEHCGKVWLKKWSKFDQEISRGSLWNHRLWLYITSITYPGSGALYARAQAAMGSCLATLRFRSYTHTLSCSSSKLSEGELLIKYCYTFYSFEFKFYPNVKVTPKVLTQTTMTTKVIMLTRIKSTSSPQEEGAYDMRVIMRQTNSNANEHKARLSGREQVIRIERQNIICDNEGVNEGGPSPWSQWEWKSDNRNDKSDSNEVATPPHCLSGGENAKIKMINPLQNRWQLHLIASVGGNMPARFAWADIRVRSTSVLLTRTCNWPALTCHYHSRLFLARFPVENLTDYMDPTFIFGACYLSFWIVGTQKMRISLPQPLHTDS